MTRSEPARDIRRPNCIEFRVSGPRGDRTHNPRIKSGSGGLVGQLAGRSELRVHSRKLTAIEDGARGVADCVRTTRSR